MAFSPAAKHRLFLFFLARINREKWLRLGSQLRTAFAAAGGQHLTAIAALGAGQETVFLRTMDFFGLESTLHLSSSSTTTRCCGFLFIFV